MSFVLILIRKNEFKVSLINYSTEMVRLFTVESSEYFFSVILFRNGNSISSKKLYPFLPKAQSTQ